MNQQPSDSHKNAPCATCSRIPVFPQNRKTLKFRLFKPADELPQLVNKVSHYICIHCVTVSYCWPEPIRDDDGNIVKAKTASQVRDLNGLQRPSRALDDILDRAVDFTNSCGLRMIYIDQECLPHPTEESFEEDVAYQKLSALVTAFFWCSEKYLELAIPPNTVAIKTDVHHHILSTPGI